MAGSESYLLFTAIYIIANFADNIEPRGIGKHDGDANNGSRLDQVHGIEEA